MSTTSQTDQSIWRVVRDEEINATERMVRLSRSGPEVFDADVLVVLTTFSSVCVCLWSDKLWVCDSLGLICHLRLVDAME